MQQATANKLIDPVCKREVSSDSRFKSFYGNGYYYFCSQADKDEFDKEPERYTKEATVSSSSTCD
jgi:YHS domain-containing protein